MKRNLLTLSLLIVLAVGTAYAADNAVAAVDIAEVSEVLKLVDGLYVVGAVECPHTVVSTAGETIILNEEVGTWGVHNHIVVDENTIMLQGQTGNDRVVALYPRNGKASVIIRAHKESEAKTVGHLDVIGMIGKTLVLYMEFDAGYPAFPYHHGALVRISGDWESLGVDLPDETPSADLNRDGKVDSTDLLLLQAQWNPK